MPLSTLLTGTLEQKRIHLRLAALGLVPSERLSELHINRHLVLRTALLDGIQTRHKLFFSGVGERAEPQAGSSIWDEPPDNPSNIVVSSMCDRFVAWER